MVCILVAIPLVARQTDSLSCKWGGDGIAPAEELLRGRVAGVGVFAGEGNPSVSPYVTIRGLNSIFTDSAPLWIVDGVEIGRAAAMPLGLLGRNSIESITILKDLSETARYGRKGANGVIIVSTRKEDNAINWSSLAGLSTSLETAFSHSHSFSLSQSGGGSVYNTSVWYDDIALGVPHTGSRSGGYSFRYENNSGKVFRFALSSASAMGSGRSTLGATVFGESSAMTLARGMNLFPGEEYASWVDDFERNIADVRSDNAVEFKLLLSPYLHARILAGENFQKRESRVWYGPATHKGAEYNGLAGNAYSSLLAYNAAAELVFERFFGIDHHVSANLYGGVSGELDSNNAMEGSDFFTYALHSGGLSLNGSHSSLNSLRSSYYLQNAGLNVSYDFKSMLCLGASLRAEKTPKYDDAPVLYPSASCEADLRKMLLNGFDALSTLRLRLGYGMAGREQYVPYEWIGNHITGQYPVAVLGGETFYDGLDRVISDEISAAMSAGFWGDRILLNAAYYDKYALETFSVFCFGKVGQKYWISAPRTLASSSEAVLRNKGVEASVSIIPLKKDDAELSLSMTGSFNTNHIDRISADAYRGLDVGAGECFNANMAGFPAACLIGYEKQDSPLRTLLGNTVPRVLASLDAAGRFGPFSFDALLTGAALYKIADLNALCLTGSKKLTPEYVRPGDYVRLSTLAFSYDFKMKAGFPVRSVRASLNFRNLFTLTKYPGWNPDTGCYGNGALVSGLDYGSFPCERQIVAGVRLGF